MRELPFLVVHGALAWRIAGVVLIAVGYTIARILRAPRWVAAIAGLSFSGFWIFMIGRIAVSRLELDDLGLEDSDPVVACHEPAERELPLSGTSAIAIAAAAPLERDRALDVLHTELACQYVRTPETFAARLAVDDLYSDNLRRRAHDFYSEARFDEALAQGPSDVRVAALLRLGRYDDAFRALATGSPATPRERTLAALATRHWVSAARAIDDEAAHATGTRDKVRLQCLAAALRARTRQPASRALLQLAATGDDVCYVLAQSADPSLALQRRDDLPTIDQALVQLTAGERVNLGNNHYIGFDDVFTDRDPPLEIWLVPFTSHSPRQGALFEILTGYPGAAESIVATDREGEACGDTCPHLATAIAMRGGRVPVADDPIPHLVAAGMWSAEFNAAARSEAALLAYQLRTTRGAVDLAALFAVLPHVATDIAGELDLDRESWSFRPDSPFTWTRVAALRADLARISGNTLAATRWTEAAHRHAAMLADRDRLLLLLFDAIAHGG